MEHFVKILEILAWPLVVLVAMFQFKKDLGSVLRRLVKVETSAAKMMFNEELEEIEQKLPDSTIEKSGESSKWLSEMLQIAKLNPRAAIIEAWTAIEVACIELGMVAGATMPRFSPRALEEFLYQIPDFDKEMINRVMDLRKLRNRVTHGMDADFDFIDAEKYIELADKTVSALNAANKQKQVKIHREY
ncbi:hypothetical protein [Shewanella salipaludis]|uniref:DUF4145 domain-containing protein n=1 Tax=Shewanella salipaludis TaxID=2723052 RepID=A0A972JIF7_9GAMM|nr:hypothetical protein [Shewanella salipaludis]NMH64973.1 hypothetical protein [Shewanella salipaludis]